MLMIETQILRHDLYSLKIVTQDTILQPKIEAEKEKCTLKVSDILTKLFPNRPNF